MRAVIIKIQIAYIHAQDESGAVCEGIGVNGWGCGGGRGYGCCWLLTLCMFFEAEHFLGFENRQVVAGKRGGLTTSTINGVTNTAKCFVFMCLSYSVLIFFPMNPYVCDWRTRAFHAFSM